MGVVVFFLPLSCEASCGDTCWLDDILCGCSLTGAMIPYAGRVHFQLWGIRIFYSLYLNVDLWVSRKANTKSKSKESQVELKLLASGTNDGSSHTFERTLPHNLSVLSLLWARSSADCVLCFQRWEFKYSFQILEERVVSSGGCCRLYLVCGSTSVKTHSSPVFSFQHSLHSSIDVGWRISSPATTVRKQNVLWCYCPAGPSWVISMHNRHTPVNRSRLEVKGEWS